MNRIPVPRAPRVRFVHPVWLQPLAPGEKSERLHSSNLSMGGMFIQSAMPPPKGAQYDVLLESKGKAFRLARAEVIWQQTEEAKNSTGFGVRFLEVRPRAQELLEYLVGHSQPNDIQSLEKTQPNPQPPMPTVPAEVVHFPAPPKSSKLPERYFEGNHTSLYDIPDPAEDTPTHHPVPLTQKSEAAMEDVVTDETAIGTLKPSHQRMLLVATFALAGAVGMLIWGTVKLNQAPLQVEEEAAEMVPLPPPVETAATPEAIPAATTPEARAEPEASPAVVDLPDGPTTIKLAGAVKKVEALVIENTLEAELFLLPNTEIKRWFMLENPSRLVIDVSGPAPRTYENRDMIAGIKVRAAANGKGMRMVFDLPMKPQGARRDANRFMLVFPNNR